MSKLFDVEVELAEFNLERMNYSGKANLLKVAELMGTMDVCAWMDFIDNGSLDLTALANELQMARSSLYQNPNIRRYVLGKAQALMTKGLIVELPYQNRDKSAQGKGRSTERYRVTDEEIMEKNAQIKRLELQVTELSARLDGVKVELREAQQKLERADLRALHMAQFGRYLR